MKKLIICMICLINFALCMNAYAREFNRTGYLDTEGSKNPLFSSEQYPDYYFSFNRKKTIAKQDEVFEKCKENCKLKIQAKLLFKPEKKMSSGKLRTVVAGEYEITKVISVEKLP